MPSPSHAQGLDGPVTKEFVQAELGTLRAEIAAFGADTRSTVREVRRNLTIVLWVTGALQVALTTTFTTTLITALN